MRLRLFAVSGCLAACFAMVLAAEQAPSPAPAGAPAQGGGRTGGAGGAPTGQLIGGTRAPAKPDERGWGWQAGGGSFGQAWPGVNYRQTYNDNVLVTVMIETLEGVANAEEIAATAGVDVIILGNNDLSSFSGWAQNDPRYQDAVIKVHDAALKYGKYFGNAGSQNLNGYVVSADTRMVQNGPARDGWVPPRGGGAGRTGGQGAAPAGRGGRSNAPAPDPEPVIGLPGK